MGEPSCIVLKAVLPEPFLFLIAGLDQPLFPDRCEKVSTDPFIAQGRVVTMRPEGPTGGPEVIETLYSI
jgi:hypothetical protein